MNNYPGNIKRNWYKSYQTIRVKTDSKLKEQGRRKTRLSHSLLRQMPTAGASWEMDTSQVIQGMNKHTHKKNTWKARGCNNLFSALDHFPSSNINSLQFSPAGVQQQTHLEFFSLDKLRCGGLRIWSPSLWTDSGTDTSMEETVTWSFTLTWSTTRSATCSTCGRWAGHWSFTVRSFFDVPQFNQIIWFVDIVGATCYTGWAGRLCISSRCLRSEVQWWTSSSESNNGQGTKTLHGPFQRENGHLWGKSRN